MSDIINFILSLTIAGLPLFVSDRVEVVKHGENSRPMICQYYTYGSLASGADGSLHDGWQFFGPLIWLDLYADSDALTLKCGELTLLEYPGPTSVFADLDSSLGKPLYSPIQAWENVAPGGPRVYEVNWVGPSAIRLIEHGMVGFIVALAFDLTFWCTWGVIVQLTRFYF